MKVKCISCGRRIEKYFTEAINPRSNKWIDEVIEQAKKAERRGKQIYICDTCQS